MSETFTHPAPHTFTVEEFHRIAEIGVFRDDDRIELLDGRIIDMTPIGSRHAACVTRLSHLLLRGLHDRAIVSVQNPMMLDRRSEPQPDIMVLLPRADYYAAAHPRPGDVTLLIEVCETTAAYDRAVKMPLYARGGITETWLVDLLGEGVEIFRDPSQGGYRSVVRAQRGSTISPLRFPEVTLEVAKILG